MKHTHFFKTTIAILLIAITILSFVGCSTNSPALTPDRHETTEYTTIQDGTNAPINNSYCEVVRVVDGDTFIVRFEGKNVRIRLSCVDTPESVANNSSLNCEEGRIASDFVKQLLTAGTIVKIETDTKLYDGNDRVLAYVYLEDGTMLNRLLLEMGYAKVFNDNTNHKFTEEFFEIQDTARDEGVGFWPTNPWQKKK